MMRPVIVSSLLFALIGAGLACPLIAAQVVSPGRQILSASQFNDYRLFFDMGSRLSEFALLGWIAATCSFTLFMLWAARELEVGERTDALWGLRVTFLHALYAAAVGFALWFSIVAGTPFALRHATLADVLVLAPAATLLARGAWGPLAVAAVFCLGAGMPGEAVVEPDVYPVPSFLWTHFGPVGIFVSATAFAACIGTGVGLGVYGLSPAPGPGRLRNAALLSLVCATAAIALQLLWLAPRYQIGRDLRTLLALHPGPIPGRTIVWLDEPRAAVQQPATTGWSTDENIARVADWLRESPPPSAQTRPAAAVTGNRYLYDWEPDRALEMLALQQRRQPNDSNLIAAMVEILRSTALDPSRIQLAQALADPARFVCTGVQARRQLRLLLLRAGIPAPGKAILGDADQNATSTGLALEWPERDVPRGEIRGRLVLDGKPLASARVALFHTVAEDAETLRNRARESVEQEVVLIANDRDWLASSRAYMSLRTLRASYAVVSTAPDGTFHFTALDRGHYLLAVRLPTTPDVALENGAGIVSLTTDRASADVGALRVRQTSERKGPRD